MSKSHNRPGSQTRYRIDAANRIVEVDSGWDCFATANGASHLTLERLRGRPLLEFFADQRLRYIYQLLIDSVREHGGARRLPFRCDGPECRRYMELNIRGTSSGFVDFCTRLVKEEPRQKVKLLMEDVTRDESFLTICSWCKKVKVDAQKWLEVEQAIAHLDLFYAQRLPALTHGICQGCLEDLRSQLGTGTCT